MADMLSVGTFGWWTTASGGGAQPVSDAFTACLDMTCTIQRATQADEDAAPVWSNLATAVDCLLESRAIKEPDQIQITDTAKAVIEELNLMLPKDQDVTEKDRITAIARKSDGASIELGPLYIKELNRVEDPMDGDEHHVEVMLKRENKDGGG